MIFQKEVIVCRKCGEKYSANSKFCPNCGEPAMEPAVEEKVTQRESFAGQIKKCPNCGAIIPSYTFKCPDCGIELSNLENNNSSIKDFSNRIVEYDEKIAIYGPGGGWSTWGTGKKIGWVILNVYLLCIPLLIYNSKKKNNPQANVEVEKRSFVENYVFPNDRQSILDAMIFVRDRLLSLTNNSSSEGYEWAKIWRNKAEHLHQQAELLYPGDSIANSTYKTSLSYYKQVEDAKQAQNKKTMIIVAVVIAVSLVIYYVDKLLGISH